MFYKDHIMINSIKYYLQFTNVFRFVNSKLKYLLG